MCFSLCLKTLGVSSSKYSNLIITARRLAEGIIKCQRYRKGAGEGIVRKTPTIMSQISEDTRENQYFCTDGIPCIVPLRIFVV